MKWGWATSSANLKTSMVSEMPDVNTCMSNFLPVLDWIKLKTFAEDNLKVVQRLFLSSVW